MILIYNDEGVGKNGLYNLQQSLISQKKRYMYVDSQFICTQNLSNYTAIIILGGADLYYCKKLNGIGNQKIREFVSQGGTYVGICAGAYYASASIEFTGEGYTIFEERELSLFQGKAIGSLPELTNNIYYNEQTNSKNIVEVTFKNTNFLAYYHGGPEFIGADSEQIIAKYNNNKVAAISKQYGKGYYILTGFHFEIEAEFYRKYLTQIENTDLCGDEIKIIDKLAHSTRKIFWKYILMYL